MRGTRVPGVAPRKPRVKSLYPELGVPGNQFGETVLMRGVCACARACACARVRARVCAVVRARRVRVLWVVVCLVYGVCVCV